MADDAESKYGYTEDELAQAAEATFGEDDDVSGFRMDPSSKIGDWGNVGMKFMDNLTKVSGGVAIPGCCVQGCENCD